MPGPSDQQPVNPNLVDAVNRMATASDVFARAADKIESSMDAAARSSEVMMKNFDMTKLADMVAIFDDVEEATKEIAGYAKKMRTGIFNTKNAADAVKYATQIKNAQIEMLKKTKENTLAWQASSKSIEKLDGFVAKMQKRVGDMNSSELREFGKILHEAEMSADKIFKKLKDAKISHINRQVNAIGKVVAPGYTAKIEAAREKHFARQDQIKEQSRVRLAMGRATADDRRAKALGDMGKNPSLLDKGGKVDLGSESVRQVLAAKMGYRGKRAQTFIAGEHQMALGGTGGGEKYEKLMEHGGGGLGGALSEVATVVETMGGTIEGALAAFAPEIEVLVLVIGALVDAFESFTKQNKQIEAAAGKGGIFNAGGDAFGAARASLNPRGFGYSQLGVTMERNMNIAQAMVQGGRGVSELVTGGPETANMGPGAKGEFMQGPIGQVQRVVTGVGRLAGLTDVEGVEQVLKNLNQYGQTIEGTEKFFVQLNKDTQAAGISTTKYLAIIDEVSSHFDRMNKSLGETMGFLRELGRTGAVGQESLKDLLDFMAGAQKPDVGSVAQRAFLEMGKRSGLQGAQVRGETANIQGMISNNLMPALSKMLPAEMMPEGLSNLANMPEGQAQAMIASLKSKIGHAVDANGNPVSSTSKVEATGALDRISKAIQERGVYSRKGGLDRAALMGLTGQDLVGSTADQLNAIEMIHNRTGIPMNALVSGDFSKVSGPQAIMAQQLATQFTGIKDPVAAMNAVQQGGQLAGQNRVDFAIGNQDEAKKLVNELLRLPGFRAQFKTKKYQMDGEEAVGFLQKNASELSVHTGALKSTNDWFVEHGSKIPTVKQQEQADALRAARAIGRQTQGIEEAIKNAMNIWMTKLVSGVESLVDLFKLKWGGDTVGDKELQKSFNAAKDTFDSNLKMLHDAMGKNRAAAKDLSGDALDQANDQYDAMQDIERKITAFKDQDTFANKDEAMDYKKAQAQLTTFGTNYVPGQAPTSAVGFSYGATAQERADKMRNSMPSMDSMLDFVKNLPTNSTSGGKTINQHFYGTANTHLTPGGSQVDSKEKVNSNGQAQ